MIINAFEFDLETVDGKKIPVALRLTLGAQIKLKKQFGGEFINTTIFTAIDDPERLAAVLDEALNFQGNTNTIKHGAELADLMALNGMLGMCERQKMMIQLAYVSGIISDKERSILAAKADEYMNSIGDVSDVGDKPKNV